jgi:hypothetical protein
MPKLKERKRWHARQETYKHKHAKKKNARNAIPAPGAAARAGTHGDGGQLDRVQYLEAKLILKPDRFTSVQGFRDFGKLVQRCRGLACARCDQDSDGLSSLGQRAAKP